MCCYHAFAAAAEIGGRRVDAILIAQEDWQHRLFLDRVLGREALPQRGVGGANPDASSSAMAPADDAATPDGLAASPPAPMPTTAAPSVGDNATPALPPAPQNEGWFHSLLESVGLAGSTDKEPPAPIPPSDNQKPVDDPPPPPPPPKPEFRRVPDFDEQGFPNYLPGDPYPRYEPTRPSPEPGVAERVLDAAVEGAQEGWGPGRLGLSPESEQWLQDTGQFNKPGETNPIRTLNEAWMKPLAAGADAILRGGSALFRGAQAAGVAAGLPRDIVAMPEAFLGSPDPLGMPRAPADVSAPEMALRDSAEGKPAEAPQPNEAPPPPEGSFHDRLDDFKQFRREKGLDGEDPLSHAEAARAYVMDRQGHTDDEHFVAYDANGNAITHAGTSFQKFESARPPDLEAMERDPTAKMTLHHSHPNDAGLSKDDVASLPRQGMEWVAAHGAGDELSAARLTPQATTALRFGDEVGQMRAKKLLRGFWNDTDDALSLPMNHAVVRGELTRDEATRISTEIVNRSLADAGIMEYVTTRTIPSTPFIDGMRTLANAQVRDSIRNKLPELVNHVPDSPTEPMGLRQGMARISGQDVGASSGQPGRRRGGRASAGRAGPAQRQSDLGRDQSSKTSEIRRAGAHPAAVADRDGQERAGREEKEVAPLPRVTGHELEMAPTSYGHLVILAARYERLRLDGHAVVNRETRVPIALTRERGLKEIVAPGTPPEMLLAVPAIPAMLAGARYLGAAHDPLHRPDIAKVHGFASAVEVGGRRVDVLMVVRENRQGRLFLDRVEWRAAARAA